ncbi:MAG: hypothetical protein ACP5JG_13280 [Anaerolineae bacterium]
MPPQRQSTLNRRRKAWLLLPILVLAAFLRFYKIGSLPPGDGYDPAWYGVDALQILDGHSPVFLPTNIGREVMFSYLVALVVALPMANYARTHPDQVLARSTTVSARSIEQVVGSGRAWFLALFRRGEPNALFNLPERPILDPFTGVLGALGLLGLVARRRWRLPGLLLVGWAIAALVPSLFSNYAPHFLRGAGFTVPLALVLGVGATSLGLILRRLSLPQAVQSLPLLLLVGAGIISGRDFHQGWLRHPETFIAMEVHVNRAANLVQAETSSDTHVYFSPFTPAHPVIILRARDLAPRPVGAFDSHECLVVPDAGTTAVYTSLTRFEPGLADALARWADVRTLYVDETLVDGLPRYSVFSADPLPLTSSPPAGRFGDQFAVWTLSELPDAVAPRTDVAITLGVRALRPPEITPSLFIHLYGIPTPYEGGEMWSQADSQLCTTYPAHLWRASETIIQSFVLPVPAEAPPGDYLMAMGLYPFPEGTRLPVSEPQENPHDYVVLKALEVSAP